MGKEVRVSINGQEIGLPVIEGTEQEFGLDIGKLRNTTGFITLDPGYVNTGSCESTICFVDGEKGILRYCGYPIEQIAEQAEFLETAHLLFHGELPQADVLAEFKKDVVGNMAIPEGLERVCDAVAAGGHPMGTLAAMVMALSSHYRGRLDATVAADREFLIKELLAKLPAIAAAIYRKSKGLDLVAPREDLNYCENLLNMMFEGVDGFELKPEVTEAFSKILILHADHEQNCSTSTVRVVGSSEANLFASVAAGITALWGPLHGGANQKVIEMLKNISEGGEGSAAFIAKVKDKASGVRLMGFGHRVYKNFDPRAKIISKACDDVLTILGIDDPYLNIAKDLENAALEDEYFVSRKLYPNVDFYSGIVYRAIGIPTDMFTVMFAIGRLPGWMAHWRELHHDSARRISRPRQIYTGANERNFVPLSER